jgi:hypothetical protein
MNALTAAFLKWLQTPAGRRFLWWLGKPLLDAASKYIKSKYELLKKWIAMKKFKEEIQKDEGRDDRRKDEDAFLNS